MTYTYCEKCGSKLQYKKEFARFDRLTGIPKFRVYVYCPNSVTNLPFFSLLSDLSKHTHFYNSIDGIPNEYTEEEVKAKYHV